MSQSFTEILDEFQKKDFNDDFNMLRSYMEKGVDNKIDLAIEGAILNYPIDGEKR